MLALIAIPFAFWSVSLVFGLIWSLIVIVLTCIFGLLGTIVVYVAKGVQFIAKKLTARRS